MNLIERMKCASNSRLQASRHNTATTTKASNKKRMKIKGKEGENGKIK
jgi:hypothetical protein